MNRHGRHADPGLADSASRLAQRPLGAAGVPGRPGLVHPGVGAVPGWIFLISVPVAAVAARVTRRQIACIF